MMGAGMGVARLNCSHGSRKQLSSYIALVRRLNRDTGRGVKILLDLEGPRIRIGRLKGGGPIELRQGDILRLGRGDFEGEGDLVPLDYTGPFSDVKGTKHIFVDDGNIALEVVDVGEERIKTRVATGGALREHKGVNIPGVHLSVPDITARDRENIRFGISEGVDMIAQSFVRCGGVMSELRGLVEPHLPGCLLVAKIENEEGVDNLDGIIVASDGIMVARGDLGVSLPIEEVPILQKEIIAACRETGVFSITATQMLESMVENRRPTRAEVSDIANAILDGTDYVMLSAESAVGKHPVEAIRVMERVISFTENSPYYIHGS